MPRKLDKSNRMPPLGCLEATADVPWAGGELCDLTLYLEPAGGSAAVDAASKLVQQRLAGEAPRYLSAAEAKRLVRPAPGASKSVIAALKKAGIEHVHAVGHRAVHVQGRWEDLEKVLSVSRVRYRTRDGVLVGRDGPITLADALDPVAAVFGIDNRRAVSSYVIISHVIISHVIISHVIISHVIISHTIKHHLRKRGAKDTADLRAGMRKAMAQKDRRWFTPEEIADRYNFPTGTGAGVKVAVMAFSGALGGTDQVVMGGYDEDALRRYWKGELGLSTSPKLTPVVVRGPGNWPSGGSSDTENGVDFTHEVMLDLSVIGALVPRADITVWFTEPTEQGFVDALHAVVEQDDPPDVLVICYGAPEDKGSGTSWTAMAHEQSEHALAVAALRGISVVASCGDNGAAGLPLSTRVHADYPASSAWVLGCGGTTALRKGRKDDLEIVWNDGLGASGGGVSAITPEPSWQGSARVPEPVDQWQRPGFRGRGVPDVAAVADLTTGVAVLDASGSTVMGGGTSVSAPVWAALLARVRQGAGAPLGFVAPLLYAEAERVRAGGSGGSTQASIGVRDVAKGDNGAYAAVEDGWDPCTGLGIPDGRAIVEVLTRGLP